MIVGIVYLTTKIIQHEIDGNAFVDLLVIFQSFFCHLEFVHWRLQMDRMLWDQTFHTLHVIFNFICYAIVSWHDNKISCLRSWNLIDILHHANVFIIFFMLSSMPTPYFHHSPLSIKELKLLLFFVVNTMHVLLL